MKKNCACDVTQDGECETCKAIASTAAERFKNLIGDMMRQLEAVEKEFMERVESLKASGGAFSVVGSCERCTDKYIDFAMSKIAAAITEGERSDRNFQFAASLFKSIKKACSKRGIKTLPLTERAWAKINGSSPK